MGKKHWSLVFALVFWMALIGPSEGGVAPLQIVNGKSTAGIYEGLWVTQCLGDGQQRVWQVNSSKEFADFKYLEPQKDCGVRGSFNVYPLVFRDSTVAAETWITWCTGSGKDRYVWQSNGTLKFVPFKWPEQSDQCTSQPPDNCQATVPSERWKGEYFDNPNLSGSPKMVRDDGTGGFHFDWGSGSPSASCNIPVDNFSVRWTRIATFPAGNYKFIVTVDDGARLWVGGKLLIDQWKDQAPTTYTVENIPLSGNQPVKMESYERGGGAFAKLAWAKQGDSALPDVRVDDLLWPSNPQAGQEIRFTARVKNYGNASTSATCTNPQDCKVGVGFSVNGQGVGSGIRDAALGAGESADIQMTSATWKIPGTGTFTIRAYADDANRFRESDENNNILDKQLPAGGGSTCIQSSISADHWKGEYFDNRDLSGSPKMARDDGTGSLSFDWGGGSPSSSCGIPSDNFSARFTRTVNFTPGTYKFTVTADDGVRLFVGAQLLINQWKDQSPTTYTVENISLSGNQLVKMEYYEGGGGAVAKLSWVQQGTPSNCQASVPVDQWKGEYFDNSTLSGTPKMIRNDGASGLSFDWGSGTPNAQCGIPADNFSARWTRTVSLESGKYEFSVTVDDGVKLWVGGSLLIDQWKDQAPTTYKSSIQLSGATLIKMEYYERAGGATAALSWRKIDEPLPPSGGSKLTIHTAFTGNESMRFIEATQPTVVKILDSVEKAREVKTKAPHTLIVGRINYDSWQTLTGTPEDRAQEWWNLFRGRILNNPEVDYWEGLNEPGNLNADEMAWYARFEKRRIEILAQNGRKASIGNFSQGTPKTPEEPGGRAVWEAFLPAIDAAMAQGGILGLHEYSAPTMQTDFDESAGEGWRTGRYRKVYRDFLIPMGRQIPLVITECGIDGGVTPPCKPGGCGWKSYQNADNYFSQLKWYDGLLKQDSYVLGATIFSLEIYGWDSFDIAGDVLNKLIPYVKGDGDGDIPPPSTGIIWDQRLDGLNIRLEPASVDSGQACWRLVKAVYRNFDENPPSGLPAGDHHIYLELVDGQGKRMVGQKAVVKNGGTLYLTIEDKPAPEFGANFPMYGVLGSYTAWGDGLPSDRIVGMGMPAKHHVTYYLTFQRTVK